MADGLMEFGRRLLDRSLETFVQVTSHSGCVHRNQQSVANNGRGGDDISFVMQSTSVSL